MNNFKKMEFMLDELSEDFNDHLAKSKSTFYHVMKDEGSVKKLRLSVCSKGGNIECEVLMLPNYSTSGNATCSVTLDGENAQSREGIITISTLPIEVGYHILEFATGEGIAAARVRLTGALSDSKEAGE